MHTYHDAHDSLPPPAVYDRDGQPLLSWRVLILPYIEQRELFGEFKLDEPWDSPHNLALLPKMPLLYQPYRGGSADPPGYTFYQVFVGKGAAFEHGRRFTLSD